MKDLNFLFPTNSVEFFFLNILYDYYLGACINKPTIVLPGLAMEFSILSSGPLWNWYEAYVVGYDTMHKKFFQQKILDT